MLKPNDTKQTISTIAHNHNVRLFLICLLITIILWIILTLSTSRSQRYTCPLKFSGYQQQEYVLFADSTLTFDIECSGFEHLHTLFWETPPEINITLPKKPCKSLCISDFSNQILLQLGFSEGRKISFMSDSLRLNFQKRTSKKVKVDISNLKLSFVEQYGIYGVPKVSPDSMTFYGSWESLQKLESVQIVDTQLVNLKDNTVCKLPLSPNWKQYNVRPEQESVELKINVERFTEAKYLVPLHFVAHDTAIHAKLYPSNVELTTRVAIRDYKSVSSEKFTANVFYNSTERSDTLPVVISEFPQFVHISKVEPNNVKYIIIK